jgi:two-component system LytT family response regulator
MNTNKIICIAVDDEPWALSLLTNYIKKIHFLNLVFETSESLAALEYLQSNTVQLAFMDILMPDLTGMQIMKIIQNKIPVILTTAYTEYALEGYEHNVIDYLIKPITFDRFCKAVEKARQVLQSPATVKEMTVISNTSEAKNYLFVKTDGKMVKVNFEEILFIEGLKDYIAINTKTEKLIILQNFKTMEESLPATRFIRVHKSYIVSLEKIDSVERNRIFIGTKIIPVGDTYKDAFFTKINKPYYN